MVLRRLARTMLASPFIGGGLDTLRNPSARAAVAAPIVDRLVEAATPAARKLATKIEGVTEDLGSVPVEVPTAVHDVAAGHPLPFETEAYVKANAAVQLGAGLLLAAGKAPRLASVALAATLVPTTIAGHRFWELEGEERTAQQIHFTKNLAMLGGLLLAALDTEGRPDLRHRVTASGSDAGQHLVERASELSKAAGAKAQGLVDAVERG
ncbi:MAG: DoxX family protein [Acidimicrobiales bacterium]|nr:DoxX family protein [Acidimicrobiales bacterium]